MLDAIEQGLRLGHQPERALQLFDSRAVMPFPYRAHQSVARVRRLKKNIGAQRRGGVRWRVRAHARGKQ